MRLCSHLVAGVLVAVASSTILAAPYDPNLPRQGEVGYIQATPYSTAPVRFCVGAGNPDPARCAHGDGPGVFVMTSDELLQYRCRGAKKISEEIVRGGSHWVNYPLIIRFLIPEKGCPKAG